MKSQKELFHFIFHLFWVFETTKAGFILDPGLGSPELAAALPGRRAL